VPIEPGIELTERSASKTGLWEFSYAGFFNPPLNNFHAFSNLSFVTIA
jgi:hypothetical protein